MGRAPCCDKQGLKRGPWTPEEDKILVDYIQSHGHGSWRSLPKLAGLLRCGKSCRLRWTNYLRPDIKRGPFTNEEQKSIIQLHAIVGNKWSTIAAQLPGRTDNEIKNYWNTHLKKRLAKMGIDTDAYCSSAVTTATSSSPSSLLAAGAPVSSSQAATTATRHMAQWESARLEAEARLSRESALYSSSASVSSSGVPAATNADTVSQPAPLKLEPADFFLRIWDSEVGKAFRSREPAVAGASSPAAASSSTKRAGSVVVKEEGEEELEDGDGAERMEEVECKSSVDSWGSNEVEVAMAAEDAAEDAAEESYQLYLDFATGEDMVGLFQSGLGGFSLFGSDLSEAVLDPAFR